MKKMISSTKNYFTPFLLGALGIIDMNNNIIKNVYNNNNNVRQCLSVCLSDKKRGERQN
jgi:hypothetical protein